MPDKERPQRYAAPPNATAHLPRPPAIRDAARSQWGAGLKRERLCSFSGGSRYSPLRRSQTRRRSFSGARGDSRSRWRRKEPAAEPLTGRERVRSCRERPAWSRGQRRQRPLKRNRPGVSGAITEFVPLHTSLRDPRAPPLPPRLLTREAINGFGGCAREGCCRVNLFYGFGWRLKNSQITSLASKSRH
jgi:hypothetical protein